MRRLVYMDNAATTHLREEALQAMVYAYRHAFGNSSSVHIFGQEARRALEEAREEFASCVGARPEEIIFTGGGTESDNLAIRGVAMALRELGNHIITCATEHHAVLHCCQELEREGFQVTYLPVDSRGLVDLECLRDSIREETILITVMTANNETGVLQPIGEIARMAREKGVLLHTDAVQAAGKMSLDVDQLGADLVSFSGHKFYGPKGVGALFVRQGTPIRPIMQGGHHEGGLRPGTVNVPGIVGMARALSATLAELEETAARLRELKEALAAGIMETIPGVYRNGDIERSLPNVLNMSFEGAEGESLLLGLDVEGIAVSTGSACTSGSVEPSHVLLAMGVPPQLAQCSLRFSLGRENSEADIAYVLEVLPGIVQRIRRVSGKYRVPRYL